METISEHHVNPAQETARSEHSAETNDKQGADREDFKFEAMADRRRQEEEEDYVIAFKSGNKLVAVQLLPRIPQPAAITTTFKFNRSRLLALVSLLHLAAYWGWRNVVTALVSVYKCAANCKDEEGHIPLHTPPMPPTTELHPRGQVMGDTTYACHGNLNIAQYLIREEHCNPSCENNDGDTPLHYACR